MICDRDLFRSLPVPKAPHLIFEAKHTKVIIVGDIHGCFDEFLELLEKCSFSSNTTHVILLGDLVNKGPRSAEVVKFARRNKFLCVRGNHDQDALIHALNLCPTSLPRPSYLSYLDDLDEDDINWLKELPYIISVPSLGFGCVHAGLIPGLDLDRQDYNDLVTMRNLILEGETFRATSVVDCGVPWIEHFRGDPIPFVYFGHDAKRGLQQTDYVMGLDTGCVYGKRFLLL